MGKERECSHSQLVVVTLHLFSTSWTPHVGCDLCDMYHQLLNVPNHTGQRLKTQQPKEESKKGSQLVHIGVK